MLTVVETSTFRRTSAGIWNANEVAEFIDFISQNPNAGDVIPGTKALRKVRWSRAGTGKRGGARVIYFVRNEQGEIQLLVAYTKGDIENLPTAFLNRLKELYDV